ncbi:lysine--tRNA ligase [Shimia sp.]|uniref:lysine--tRNA ligase n=1 Tax=Shimia sp. TaxID=1954381 RepID=UPI0032978A4A
MSDLRDAALVSKAWPFEEARRLLKRYKDKAPEKGYVLFQTGYGPSGLPHIGTFGEVARTSMVRHAFEMISDIPTRLICFSDDMDGFRKVPTNLPMQDELKQDLNLPLTKVRDPFGTHEGFAQHNNARLCTFLDSFGFEYEFASATDYYQQGKFDGMLQVALERFDKIMEIMLPTLGAERQETYSPFLPVSPKTGHVLQVPTLERNVDTGTIVYEEPDGERIEVPVTGGHVKMQWKPDWALRWAALGVDYEMSGKDLIDSVTQSSKICRALGQRPPESLSYELFNDEQGQKISKSKGNGLSMEEWLTYAAPASLQYFMYLKPKTAKRLYFDVIPKAVDEYHQQLRAYPGQELKAQLNNPVYHIHGGNVPESNMVVPFAMLLNLASVAGAEEKDQLWGFIQRYAPEAGADSHPDLDAAAGFAVRYYNDFVKPAKVYRAASDQERAALEELRDKLRDWDGGLDAEELQSLVFSVGRERFDPMRDWFKALYEVLLGASQGPRFGGFIALYGVDETIALIDKGLAGELL